MAPLPRRLRFVVGTSLLGASLSLGCTGKPAADEAKKVDEAKKADAKPDVKTIQPEIEGPNINEGPIVEPPPPPPPELHVNPGPEPVPEPAPEPKRVNTRPTDI